MAVKTTIERVRVLELKEKAVSKKQQRFFGMVRAAQKGEGAASPEVAKVAGEISKQDAKDFAKTKHKGLPEKKAVKEELTGDMKTDLEKYRVPRGPGGNPIRIGDKVRSMNSNQPLGKLKVKYGADKVREYYKKNKAVGESYVIEKEDSPYEHASRGSLAGKTRSTGTSEKEHKTSFRRKAHRNSAAMIIKAKRKAERSGKKLSDDSAADLAHKGWASSVKHHKSSMTPEQQKRRQKLADTPYKKLSKDEQDKDKVSAKAIMSVHDKQKKKTVKEASAVLDANKKLEGQAWRKKKQKEYAKLIAIYNHQKQLEKQGLGSPTKRKKTSESFEIDKSAHKKAQRQSKIRNLAKDNKNPNEKAAAERKLKGPKLAWEEFKKHI